MKQLEALASVSYGAPIDCDDTSERAQRAFNALLAEETTEQDLLIVQPKIAAGKALDVRVWPARAIRAEILRKGYLSQEFEVFSSAGRKTSFDHYPDNKSLLSEWAERALTDVQVFPFGEQPKAVRDPISSAAVKLVREGMKLVAQYRVGLTANSLLPKVAEQLTNEEISNFIRERFEVMLSVIADEQRYSGANEHLIATAGGFLDKIDYEIRDRIPVAPKKFSDLSNSLHEGLVTFLAGNGVIEAAWGKLALRGSDVVMEFITKKPDTPHKGRRAILDLS